MPYPSRGCKTCRTRRIKCDETRPICSQCIKSGRVCTGFENIQGNLQFRSENVYARGVARRPRGSQKTSAGKFPSFVTTLSNTEVDQGLPKGPKQTSPRTLILRHGRSNGQIWPEEEIQQSLNTSLEERAICYYVRDRLDKLPSEPHNMNTCLKRFLLKPGPSNPASSLNMAIQAVSFAVFGRRENSPAASSAAVENYGRALVKTRLAILDPNQTTSDELLHTVMLLFSYENVVCDGTEDKTSVFVRGFRHQSGAIAMLEARKRLRQTRDGDLSLDKFVRRQIIRSAIHHGYALPPFLHDGASFEEEGIELELDSCLVELAVLRNKALSLARDLQTSLDEAKQRKVKADKQTLIARARALDERLATWEENLADDWKFEQIEFESIQSNESDFSHENFIFGIFGNVAHHYPSIWQATLWNQYRTARIAVNIIIARALFRILSEDGMNGRSHILALQERAQSEIKTQVDQLCASFPFFFGLFDNKNQRRTITAEEMKAAITRRTASTAFLLVWPITIASAAAEIPEEQKRWIKSKIVLLGRLTGNRILEVAATMNHPRQTLPLEDLEPPHITCTAVLRDKSRT